MKAGIFGSVGVLAISMALGAGAGPAAAQTNATAQGGPANAPIETNSGRVSEIVVTARRREEALQDVPVAVTAVTQQMIQQRVIKNINQLAEIAPNLTFQQAGANPGEAFIGMRGQQAETINPTSDPPVTIYIDGVASVRAFGLQSALLDVDRVEVLHGPQGTLFGKNTTGGAISIITKSPGDRFGGFVTAGYGNFNAYEVTGAVDLPLGDKAALRLLASKGAHKGYGESTATGEDFDMNDHWAFRGHLRVQPLEGLKIDLISDFYKSVDGPAYARVVTISPTLASTGGIAAVGGAPFGMLSDAALVLFGADTAQNRALALPIIQARYGWPPQNDPWKNGAALTPRGRYQTSSTTLNTEWNLGDVTARSISGFRHYTERSAFVLNPTPYGFPFSNSNFTKGTFYSEELQLLGDLADHRLKYVVGAYGNYERDLPVLPPATGKDRVINSSLAGFAQVDYQVAPTVTVTAGARYTHDKRELREFSTALPTACPAPFTSSNGGACARLREATFGAWGYVLSVNWKPTPDVLAYVKTSRANIAGGFNPGAQALGPASVFNPETLTNYEVGLKSEFLEHRVRFNVAAYWGEDTNLQRNVITPTGLAGASSLTSAIHNAGKARIPGIEAELEAHPTSELTLTGTIGQIWPKYIRFSAAGPNNTVIDLRGTPWVTPKFTYSIGAHYSHLVSWGDTFLDVSWSGQNGYNTCISTCVDPVGPFQKQYGLLNGAVGFDLTQADVRVSLWGRNLLNKAYLTATIGLDNIPTLGYNEGLVGNPRTFGVQVTKRF